MRDTRTRPGAPACAALVTFLALAAPGCRSTPVPETAPPEPEDIVVAYVNDEPLTLRDAMDAFLSSHAGHGVLVKGEPAVRELVGRLVEQQLFFAEAVSLGVPDDERVHTAVDLYEQNLAETVFWRREVTDKSAVSDEEAEAFYAKTDVALSIHVMQADTYEEAEELLRRYEAGEDFEDLAQAKSSHSSRTFGGSLNYVRRGELEPALEEAAFALREPGSLSPIVATESGHAFVRLDERSENAEQPPRELLLPQIREILKDRREDELRAEVEARVRDEADVSIDATLITRDTLLASSTPEAVVASAAGESLTLGEVRESLNLDAIHSAPDEKVAEGVMAIVDRWAMERAVKQAVARSGLLEDPEVAEPTEGFRRDAIIGVLNRYYVFQDVDPTEEEIRAYYEEHRETGFTRPPEVHMAYIVVATEDEALDILQRASAGEDFADLARQSSIDATSAAHGGRIGWIRPGQILEEVEERAFELEPGALDGPIATEAGYFVISVMECKEPVEIPYAEARRTAQQRLSDQLRKEAYTEWTLLLKERAAIEIHEEGIHEAVAWLDVQAELAEAEKAAEKAAAEAAGESPDAGAMPHGMPSGGAPPHAMPPANAPSPEDPSAPEDPPQAGGEQP